MGFINQLITGGQNPVVFFWSQTSLPEHQTLLFTNSSTEGMSLEPLAPIRIQATREMIFFKPKAAEKS